MRPDTRPAADDVKDARAFLWRLRLARWLLGIAGIASVVVFWGPIAIHALQRRLAHEACLDEAEATRVLVARGGLPVGAVVHEGSEGTVVEAPRAFVLLQDGAVVALSPRCPR